MSISPVFLDQSVYTPHESIERRIERRLPANYVMMEFALLDIVIICTHVRQEQQQSLQTGQCVKIDAEVKKRFLESLQSANEAYHNVVILSILSQILQSLRRQVRQENPQGQNPDRSFDAGQP